MAEQIPFSQFVTQLSKATVPLTGKELIPLVQGGVNRSVTTNTFSSGTTTVTPQEFGAVADGGNHPLSTVYPTLASAQAVYPFVTSLTQQIDYAAVQLASYTAFGFPGSENSTANAVKNKRLYLPGGKYYFGSDTWSIRNLASGVIYGDGLNTTVITGTNTLLSTDGFWFVHLSDMAFEFLPGSSGTMVVSIDGNSANIPGHTYATFGVQGCCFQNLLISGLVTQPYGMTLEFYSGGTGQGSEMQYLNCHFISAKTACYAQFGFNALGNQFVGGDMQVYPTHGIYTNNSPVNVFGMDFESTYGYTQYLNGGFDVIQFSSGALATGGLIGCRSESFQFFNNGGSNYYAIASCSGNQALATSDNSLSSWFPNFGYGGAGQPAAVLIAGNTFSGIHRGQVWVATTPGTSGGVQPSWPTAPSSSTTVSDGGVTWTYLDYNFISNTLGSIDYLSTQNVFNGGRILGNFPGNMTVGVTSSYTVGNQFSFPENYIQVDCTGGPVTITLDSFYCNISWPLTIQKVDSTANHVTIATSAPGFGIGPSGANTLTAQWQSRTYIRSDSVGGGQNIISVIASYSGSG